MTAKTPPRKSAARAGKPRKGKAAAAAAGAEPAAPRLAQARDAFEQGDWAAVDHALGIRTRGQASSAQLPTHTAERMLAATGTYPIVGGYDDVVGEFRRMSEAGLDGIAIGLVNYIDDMPALRDEILPRLERLGLRGRISEN